MLRPAGSLSHRDTYLCRGQGRCVARDAGGFMTLLRAMGVVLTASMITAGCTLVDGAEEEPDDTVTIKLLTHGSWAVPDDVLNAFEERSGIRLQVLQEGDAGELTNKLVLGKSNPEGDVAFGVDPTFATRAL